MERIVDWKKLLTELMAAGLTQKVIADELELSQGAVSHLLTGRTAAMQWEKGEKLIALHKARVPADLAQTTA
jgi:predicted transcriptional regulator